MRSHTGIRIIRAKGSKLERTSLGTPCVDMVAACDVRLLLSWLYVNPTRTSVASKIKGESRDVQYRGYQQNTPQALIPRFTSSTQTSSNVIHEGLFSGVWLLGLALSQNPSALKFLYILTGFKLHFPRAAYAHRRREEARTEPVGGERAYLLRPIHRTTGQIRKTTVGRV